MYLYNMFTDVVTGPPLAVYFTTRQLTDEEKRLKIQLDSLRSQLGEVEKKIEFQMKSIKNQIGMEESSIHTDEYLQSLKLSKNVNFKNDKNLLRQKSIELNKQFKDKEQERREVSNMELKYINRELKKKYGEDEIRKQIEQVEEKLYPPANFLQRIKESPTPVYKSTSEDDSVEINN